MAAVPGTIPALTPYQPAALQITGRELVEIASSDNATAAISGSMLITDIVGKAPSVLPSGVPAAGDVVAFYQTATQLPKATNIASLALIGNVATAGSAGQIFAKNSGTNFDASWFSITSFVSVGTSLTTSGTDTAIVIGIPNNGIGSTQLSSAAVPLNSNIVTGFLNTMGFARVTTSMGQVSSTTLLNVTGLSIPLPATSTFFFRANLYMTCGSTGGATVGVNFTQSVNAIIYDAVGFSQGGLSGQGRATTLAVAITAATTLAANTTPTAEIRGTITTNSSGTLTMQIAQVVATTTTTLALSGSMLEVFQVT